MDNQIDTRSVADRFKGWTNELIKKDCQENNNGFSLLMTQLSGDFNIGTVIRSGNSFGVKEVFYFGNRKKYDRRGAVGSYHYTDIVHLKEQEELLALKENYSFIALEQDAKSVPLQKFDWNVCGKTPLIMIGEEGCGLSSEMLALADHIVEIPSFGSVRSLNAGVASSICMWDFMSKMKL